MKFLRALILATFAAGSILAFSSCQSADPYGYRRAGARGGSWLGTCRNCGGPLPCRHCPQLAPVDSCHACSR